MNAGPILDQSTSENGGRTRDYHLVETTRGVSQRNEDALPDIASPSEPKNFHQTEGDRRHDNHAGDSGRHQEGQQERRQNDPQKHSRITCTDSLNHHISQPARQAGFCSHHSKQTRTKKKPRSLIGKSAEGDLELNDLEHPKQVAANKSGKRMRNRHGDPGENHEGGDRESVLGSQVEIKRSEPKNYRHDDGQDSADDFSRGDSELVRSANLHHGLGSLGHYTFPFVAASLSASRPPLGTPTGSAERAPSPFVMGSARILPHFASAARRTSGLDSATGGKSFIHS